MNSGIFRSGSLLPAAVRNRLLAVLLVLAFVIAGLKVLGRPAPADFALPSAAPGVSARAAPGAGPPLQPSPDGRFRFQAQFVSAAPGQAVHAASLVELRNGDLRAVWFSGSREGARDVTIETAVMDGRSLQWSPQTTLLGRQALQQGLWRYVKKLGNPVIARAPDGSLYLWMVTVSLGGWAGSAITWTRSTDDGASWTVPRRLVTSPFLNISTLVKGAPVAYADGHMGLPVYHEFVSKFAEILRLDAHGQVVDKQRIPASQTSLQPVVLVSGTARAQVFMRSSPATALMAADTHDAGRTWSSARPSAWPNPDSALAGVVTRAGAQWLAINPSSVNREALALLQASAGGGFDSAAAWTVESSASAQRLSVVDYEALLARELAARGASAEQVTAYVASARRQLCGQAQCSQEFSYPYLLQASDGYLHLVYTWHRARIKHVRLDPLQALQPRAALRPAFVHAAAD